MALTARRGHAVEVGVLAGIVDLLVFSHFTGIGITDILGQPPHDTNTEKGEREALYVCLGINTVTSLLLRSWDTFVVSGVVLIGVDFAVKHANAVSPATGKMTQGQQATGSLDISNVMPLPTYQEQYGYGG